MATVLKQCFLSLGGTDRSTLVQEVTIDVAIKDVDTTTFGSGGWEENAPGLKSGTIKIKAVGDSTVSGLDQQVWAALIGAGTLAFVVRQDSGSISTTNPSYSGTATITGDGIGGKVGELASKDWSWKVSGAVTRATSA